MGSESPNCTLVELKFMKSIMGNVLDYSKLYLSGIEIINVIFTMHIMITPNCTLVELKSQ